MGDVDADAPPIPDGVVVYRRVHPEQVVEDKNRRCQRLSTGAFTDRELSVDYGDDMDRHGLDFAFIMGGREEAGWTLVGFPAGVARAQEQDLRRDPSPEDPAHGLIVGKKTEARRKHLARACAWVIPPENACDPPFV